MTHSVEAWDTHSGKCVCPDMCADSSGRREGKVKHLGTTPQVEAFPDKDLVSCFLQEIRSIAASLHCVALMLLPTSNKNFLCARWASPYKHTPEELLPELEEQQLELFPLNIQIQSQLYEEEN